MSDRVSARHLAPGPGGHYEPQRSYDWQIQLNVPGAGDIIWTCDQAFAPTESNEQIELHYGNEVQYVAGKARFEPGQLSVRDMVDIDMQAHINAWRRMVYDPKTGAVNWATDYKTNGYLVMLDPKGSKSRKWKLIGLWPSQVAFAPALDYNNNDIVRIDITLTYDRAFYEG